jgi:hypothetical protein
MHTTVDRRDDPRSRSREPGRRGPNSAGCTTAALAASRTSRQRGSRKESDVRSTKRYGAGRDTGPDSAPRTGRSSARTATGSALAAILVSTLGLPSSNDTPVRGAISPVVRSQYDRLTRLALVALAGAFSRLDEQAITNDRGHRRIVAMPTTLRTFKRASAIDGGCARGGWLVGWRRRIRWDGQRRSAELLVEHAYAGGGEPARWNHQARRMPGGAGGARNGE